MRMKLDMERLGTGQVETMTQIATTKHHASDRSRIEDGKASTGEQKRPGHKTQQRMRTMLEHSPGGWQHC